FAEEFGDFDAVFLAEVKVPDVAVHQRDEEERAEEAHDGTHFAAEGKLGAADGDVEVASQQLGGKINGEAEGEEVIGPVEPDAVGAFEAAAQQQHEAVKPRHGKHEHQVAESR